MIGRTVINGHLLFAIRYMASFAKRANRPLRSWTLHRFCQPFTEQQYLSKYTCPESAAPSQRLGRNELWNHLLSLSSLPLSGQCGILENREEDFEMKYSIIFLCVVVVMIVHQCIQYFKLQNIYVENIKNHLPSRKNFDISIFLKQKLLVDIGAE